MLIACPHCGTRPADEFTFMGDAEPRRPQSLDPATMDQWFDYVYLRNNPKGRLHELAHHSGGCRSWLVVTRDTLSHEVFATVTVRDFVKARDGAQS
jgi:methylglutamate dehydrogenase subunit B